MNVGDLRGLGGPLSSAGAEGWLEGVSDAIDSDTSHNQIND